MTEQTPLSDILNNEPTEEAPASEAVTEEVAETPQETAEQPTQEQPEGAATDGQPRDEKGRFAPKGESEAPPASQQDDEPRTAPIAALKDERSKRQALEQEIARLRDEMQRNYQMAQSSQPAQQQQADTPPDRWEDPEGYDQWLINRATQAAQEQAMHAFHTQRITASANEARAKYQDFDTVIQAFGELVQTQPALYERMVNSKDPAEFAYTQAKTHLEIQQHGSLDALVEARLKEREAAQAQQISQLQPKLPSSAPPSISSDRSVGARSGPAWSGPTPLSSIIPQ